ncbi:hypothetical protein CONLIGDRAFT_358893 [Coniochaeta ligniaria NRRL 30616]|uniref:Zn(2)-C6 fungal-type domain-containing protein n=1 Tax=Coniochaeta ligniaria NRRL 30616 TaxID=1408157 RepID=A0A1J7JQX4_9PEZI|nr:hypothetical protein CONLIGDRAFT_358893 [Coniochaeta ligniaria NRRL 30616]
MVNMASSRKRSGGCWTCRIRRKRCDEVQPICQVCKTLHIDCVYGESKPEWMDGGERQKERMEMIKMQVKGNASNRRERKVLQSMDEPFIITSDSDFKASSRRGMESTADGARDPSVTDNVGSCEDQDEPMTGHEHCMAQATWLDSATPNAQTNSDSADTASTSPLDTLVDTRSNENQRRSPAKPEALSFPPSNHELSSLNLGRETETEFVMMWLDYVFPFLFPFYRPSLLESGRHWLLNLLRSNQVAFHTAVSLGSYFFTIALGDAVGPEERGTCRSLLWGQLARQTSLALQRIQEDMAAITRRGCGGDNLLEAARVVGSIVQQIVVEVTIKRSADWSVHLNATIALFRDIFENHGMLPSGYPDLAHLLNQMPDPPLAMAGDNPLPQTADRNAFTFFTCVLIYIDIIASTALDQPPQLASYHSYFLTNDPTTTPIRLDLVFGCQNFVFLALKETSTLSAWKKASKSAGALSVPDLVHRAAAISADLAAGVARLDAGSAATSDPLVGVTPARHFRGYYRRLENRRQDHGDIEQATRIWALAAGVYLAVVVSGWQPANGAVRRDVARALELLRDVEEPGRIRSFAWPLCVMGCMAEEGQEEDVREVVAKMGDLKEFGTVGQVLRIVEAVWSARESVDRDSWDFAACFGVLGSPTLLI